MATPRKQRKQNYIQYSISETIGRGSFATVFRGTYLNKDAAVKRTESVYKPDGSVESALRSLNHPNIVQILGVEYEADFV